MNIAPLTLQSQTVSSAEDAGDANAVAGWNLQYDQLSCGAYQCKIDQIHLPGAVIVRERSNQRVHQHGMMNHTAIGIALPMRMNGLSTFHAQSVGHDSLMIGRTDELDLCTSPVFELAGFVVQEDLLQQAWSDLFQGANAPFAAAQRVYNIPAPSAQALRARFAQAFALADAGWAINPTELRDGLLLDLIGILSTCDDFQDVRSAHARRRVVERTLSAMRRAFSEGDGEMPGLLTLCRAVGASPRKLNYCFLETLGLSPKQYLRAYRLNQVRRELRASQGLRGTVQQVAANWGFWHFGQFSADYRRQFSELPSQTMRKPLETACLT